MSPRKGCWLVQVVDEIVQSAIYHPVKSVPEGTFLGVRPSSRSYSVVRWNRNSHPTSPSRKLQHIPSQDDDAHASLANETCTWVQVQSGNAARRRTYTTPSPRRFLPSQSSSPYKVAQSSQRRVARQEPTERPLSPSPESDEYYPRSATQGGETLRENSGVFRLKSRQDRLNVSVFTTLSQLASHCNIPLSLPPPPNLQSYKAYATKTRLHPEASPDPELPAAPRPLPNARAS